MGAYGARSLRAVLAGSLLFGGVVLVLAMPAQIAGAATQLVTNCNDSGAGSLRQAVLDAASGDTVNFATDLGCSTIVLTSGDIEIATDLSIVGPGPNALAVSGNNASQVFAIDSDITASISGLTIEDGSTASLNDGQGGGIVNSGTLTVSDSTLTGNNAYIGGGIQNGGSLNITNTTLSDNSGSYIGGGIDNPGTLSVTDSTISGNTSGEGGGGIMDFGSATVTDTTLSDNTGEYGAGIQDLGTLSVLDSTLDDNSGAFGGGIYNQYGPPLTVENSTFSGNSAVDGGGIYVYQDTLNLTHGTFWDNSASLGGGIFTLGGSSNLAATIVAGSGSKGSDCMNYSGAVSITNDDGYNLDDDGSCGFTSANHSISDSTTLDLGPLANNGGPTETLLPAATSSAVGVIPTGTTLNGVQVCPRVDQRGVASVGNCTIGAVEVVASTCTAGLHPLVLNARYAKGTFTGLFCVNRRGFGTYTQGILTGFGWVTVVKGTTAIAALGKNLFLVGATKGTKSSFIEFAPPPIKFGTFTLS